MINTYHHIQEFLKLKRFAMIGVSRNAKSFSHGLYREFRDRGHEVVPVNPHIPILEGQRCFPSIQAVFPEVTAAMLLTNKSSTQEALLDCVEAGLVSVWIYGISGEREIEPSILRLCESRNMQIIAGYCPYMFLHDAAFFHRWHGTIAKFVGKYPS